MNATLDHIVINSRFDTDAAAALLSGLGFTLTPRGHHTLGSINHLMVFGDSYPEIIGLPVGAAMLRQELLDSPVGIDGLVFATSDPDANHEKLASEGFSTGPVQHFSRPLTLDGKECEARFSAVRLLPGQFEAGRVYFCRHLTPELVWRSEWMQHANGVTGMERLTIVSAEPERARAQYVRLGTPDDRFALDIVTQATLVERFGDFASIGAQRAERFAAIRLRCPDPMIAAGMAAALSLPYSSRQGRTLVAIPALSVFIEFVS